MDGNQNNFWGKQPNLNRVCSGLSADMEQNLRELQQQRVARELNASVPLSQSPFYSDTYRLTLDNRLLFHEGDQVVPSSQRPVLFGGHHKEAKPLPPLPDPEEMMSDEAADSEVEFFTSDRQRLLPKSCPRAICKGGSKDSGQVNRAYQDGMDSIAFSWPSREDRHVGRGGRFGPSDWSLAAQRAEGQRRASAVRETCASKELETHVSPRMQFSGPTFPAQAPGEKPQVPPRIPIPPKPKTRSGGEEDKPPKIPPRVPLVPPCPPRTPSPKSLPIYINGVMPVTQSFAANPNYVSKALQRQQSERAPPPTPLSPCIVPILKDGKQASATHYILLPPGRPAHAQRRERLLSEPNRTASTGLWLKR
ncbi:ERBB receptor feedback inhibitor 1 [Menidia menidia]